MAAGPSSGRMLVRSIGKDAVTHPSQPSRMRYRRGIYQPVRALGVAALIAFHGCGLLGSSRHEDIQRELNRNRRQWEAQAIQNYRYVGRRGCYCPGEVVDPVVVEVRSGQITSLTYQQSDESVGPTYAGLWPPLDGVFEIVQDAVDREAAGIDVQYHAELGFPRSISIDYMEHAVDEELTYSVEAFELLP